jgi:peroxiredoxin
MLISAADHSAPMRSCRKVLRALASVAPGIVILVAYIAAHASATGNISQTNTRKPAPEFSLTDARGTPIQLSDYKGRVVVLDFWATWCHGCKLEIPWFMEFETKYEARGLSVIGVSMDADGWKSVKPFAAARKMNYTVVIGNSDLAKQYGLGPLPMTLLIDREGRIADTHRGVVDKANWESEVQALLRAGVENASD